jgi:hypothetical protein
MPRVQIPILPKQTNKKPQKTPQSKTKGIIYNGIKSLGIILPEDVRRIATGKIIKLYRFHAILII